MTRVLPILVVLAALAGVTSASATPPGKNGPIAFRRFFDDQHTWAALFTIAPDETHARQVTHPARGTVDNSPDWSPDGRLLVFVRFDGTSDTGLEHLWTVRPDGSGLAPVGPVCPAGANETTCPDDTDPSFGPDSKSLTFVQASGSVKIVAGSDRVIEHAAIAVVNADGSGRRVVFQSPPYSSDLAAPMLSPDGTQIVFERDNSSLAKPAGGKAIFVVGSDGSGVRRLTPWAENDGDNPDWSPDGKWILFHSHVDDGKQGQYFLIHPDGTGRKQISHYPNGIFVGSASFSPDGRSITFAKGLEGGNIDVYTMRLDGTHVRRLTRSKLWDSAPDWGAATTASHEGFAAHAWPRITRLVQSADTGVSRPLKVTSTIDRKTVLPHYLHWIATPNVKPSQIREVDFLIDGKLRWVEHYAPYNYASDDLHGHLGYLFTSWLKPGRHVFSARAVTLKGKKAADTVVARVMPAIAPPTGLAGTWTRTMTTAEQQKCDPKFGTDNCPPPGVWKLIFDSVGVWELDPLHGGIVTAYSVNGSDLHAYAPIQMVPRKPNGDPGEITRFGQQFGVGGGIDCNEAGPFTNYTWSVSGDQLTLTSLDRNCGQQRAIWEGTWTRVT
jgi:TolB protein